MKIALLDNKKMIKDLVEVDTHDSILEQVKKDLSKDEFNFVVTNDNLAFAKTKMADLNKSIKFIDIFRKDKVSVESVAIDLFKSNVKEYLALIDAKREEIKKNVEVFEREAKDKILKELSLYSEDVIKSQNIREDFKEVDIADLIVLGSVTSKCSLTKKAKEVIEARVMVCKSKQDKYDFRLLNLENESRKAGLEAVLTITHVQGIISLDNDAEYQTRLNDLISSEIDRQNTIKANVQKEVEREANQKVLNEQSRIASIFNDIAVNNGLSIDEKINIFVDYDFSQFREFESFARAKSQSVVSELRNLKDSIEKAQKSVVVNDKEIPIVHETIPKDTPKVEDGKKVVLIDVHLQFKVKDSIPDDKIVAKVNQMLSDAGFNESLIGVEVVS